ncbi:nucleotidyl transferase AbiEii/AbiGii toxin family protein [Pseudomonas sp. FW306-2-2C-D06B]|uniref:Nucleotidyl transferase AbiEii/AbiGii toxin family protein n=1 Tax=Pseudomonas putida TaxID=303 RepID=A0A1L7N888_PSEPU|nr:MULTISPECIES: nucleotidyl transferase AbiEii/AbiGii toxin family protein [Pseudomonas]PMY79658.1 nucleotidyl transferase AbiEii/AbiGii toxin family protein [Pseudomonas sp. FW306-2-2C-D06B]BAW21672.1 Uncharacterized protein KF715C_ch10990 [Pseudomonas putida]GLO19868.1 hypothetical protein PPUJ20188_32650 [Pseudomonas putida]HDS0995240.1 nucleotidyl transferase AbiEii/AbiGii toxin family protein [Pseudomonas putida]HDS1760599.1 nucleotidyl transferase AbiEii/AbiGii toxin family protein [Pse
MATCYFQLSAEDQSGLLAQAAIKTGRSEAIIEKDIWVSVVLRELFSMPDRKRMAFKGGTSLSKVFSVIHRFSEDIDITIDYQELGCAMTSAEMAKLSTNARKRLSDGLKAQVREYVAGTVQPYLLGRLQALGCGGECAITVSGRDEDTLLIGYPSRVVERDGYMLDHVKIEFGGRNIIDPNAEHTIVPDVADLFPSVAFPVAVGVVVLAAQRSYWEKVTLIHDECNRGLQQDSSRQSRHWYDLVMLARHATGQQAIADLDLLADVIGIKQVFFRRSTSRYEDCLAGGLVLIPDAQGLEQLASDYAAMNEARMFNEYFVPLDQILTELAALQDQINRITLGAREAS